MIQDMVKVELDALHRLLPLDTLEKIAFVGGGALPMSAICIALQTPQTTAVTVYDIDLKASSLGRQCAERLGAKNIKFKTLDIADESMDAVLEYDAIWMANMVHDRSRKAFLAKLPLDHCPLIVRVVKGASRSILRSPIPKDTFNGFEVIARADEHPNVFYNSHLLRKIKC